MPSIRVFEPLNDHVYLRHESPEPAARAEAWLSYSGVSGLGAPQAPVWPQTPKKLRRWRMTLPGMTHRALRFPLIAVLAVAPVAFGAGDPGGETSWPTHGWHRGTPADAGLDEAVLTALDKDLANGKYSLVDSFQVFRCGAEVYSRKYDHDYGKLYSKEARMKGPLNARLTGRYNYFDPVWHP